MQTRHPRRRRSMDIDLHSLGDSDIAVIESAFVWYEQMTGHGEKMLNVQKMTEKKRKMKMKIEMMSMLMFVDEKDRRVSLSLNQSRARQLGFTLTKYSYCGFCRFVSIFSCFMHHVLFWPT